MASNLVDVAGEGDERKLPVTSDQNSEASTGSKDTWAPPNGGLKAWLQVLGSWCLVFNTMGTIVSFGVYQAYYEQHFLSRESSANISWIGSIQSLVAFTLGALSGPLYDLGYVRLLMLTSTGCIVLGHMVLSLCTEYWQVVLAQGFLVGIGAGCVLVPALAVSQPYFSTKLGMALGIVGTGSSIGCIVYSVIFINLVDRIGFAWTVRVLGFVALGLLSIPLCTLEMHARPPTVRKILDLSASGDRPFMLSALGCFLGYSGCQVCFFYVAYYGQVKGWLAGTTALYLLPIINSGSILGRVLPNILADKAGPVCWLGLGPRGAYTQKQKAVGRNDSIDLVMVRLKLSPKGRWLWACLEEAFRPDYLSGRGAAAD